MISKTTCIALIILCFDFSHTLQLSSQKDGGHVFKIPPKIAEIIKELNKRNINMKNSEDQFIPASLTKRNTFGKSKVVPPKIAAIIEKLKKRNIHMTNRGAVEHELRKSNQEESEEEEFYNKELDEFEEYFKH